MGDLLKDKVAVVTGSGRGIGRGIALQLSAEGAKVVVNDLGGAVDGSGDSATPADEVVNEIKAAGGEAVANYDSVSTMDGGENIVKTALDSFGKIDIAVEIQRPLATEEFVFQIDIVDLLRAEANVLAADDRDVLVIPVGEIGSVGRLAFRHRPFVRRFLFDDRRIALIVRSPDRRGRQCHRSQSQRDRQRQKTRSLACPPFSRCRLCESFYHAIPHFVVMAF